MIEKTVNAYTHGRISFNAFSEASVQHRQRTMLKVVSARIATARIPRFVKSHLMPREWFFFRESIAKTLLRSSDQKLIVLFFYGRFLRTIYTCKNVPFHFIRPITSSCHIANTIIFSYTTAIHTHTRVKS